MLAGWVVGWSVFVFFFWKGNILGIYARTETKLLLNIFYQI